MATIMTCPECGEQALPTPPRTLMDYAARGLPTPGWSHHDGQPLCPVAGPRGNQPADPTLPEVIGPELAGTWLGGSAARTADELSAAVIDVAIGHGMPATGGEKALLAAWAHLAPGPGGTRRADPDLAHALAEAADDAVAYLDTLTAPGVHFELDDGLHLVDDTQDWAHTA